MAEPLTSSDIQRELMGFGVSPLAAPETRRAYAAAGLSPLGTQERERFESGAGISPTASPAEREAWKMAEFQAGRREQAPIEYGGIGDRPTGTSRRAIRMQAEWDKQREAQMQMEQAQSEEQRRANAEMRQVTLFGLDQRIKELDLELKEKETAIGLTNAIKGEEQASAALDVISSYPDTPEGLAQAQARLAKELPFSLNNQVVQKVLYGKGQSVAAMQSAAQVAAASEEAAKEEEEEQAKLQADFVTYGITLEQQKALLVPNLPAGVIRYDINRAQPVIAAAKKAGEEAKEARGEEKAEKKDFMSRLRNHQKALAAYKSMVETMREGKTPEQAARVGRDPEVQKAMAAAKATAAVLDLPKINSEADLKNYKKGDSVLAPDGITVITVP